MGLIQSIVGREIFDSRGYPTVEVDVHLDHGAWGRFSVPSGASTGSKEALELRDLDPKRMRGKGVQKAISHVNGVIAQALVGRKWDSQKTVDEQLISLDGSANKTNLGANAILGVSMAFARASAMQKGQSLFAFLAEGIPRLPMPLINVINGGAHADNPLDIQEFMIVPVGAAGFREALQMSAEHFYALKDCLKQKGLATSVGDEGGFAPAIAKSNQALELLSESARLAGLRPGRDVAFALDVAASELFDKERHLYEVEGQIWTSQEMVDWLEGLCEAFPICSIEDPLAENDLVGFELMMRRLGKKLQIVGDDLFVTNPTLVQKGVEQKLANAVLVKLNQVGTLTETLETIHIAQKAEWSVIISHRSGETEDTSIADLAVAVRAQQIKTGSLSRSERIAKYNRLLRIEEELGSQAQFVGKNAFPLI